MIYPLSSPSSLDKDNLTLELMENLLKCLTSQVTNTTCLNEIRDILELLINAWTVLEFDN